MSDSLGTNTVVARASSWYMRSEMRLPLPAPFHPSKSTASPAPSLRARCCSTTSWPMRSSYSRLYASLDSGSSSKLTRSSMTHLSLRAANA